MMNGNRLTKAKATPSTLLLSLCALCLLVQRQQLVESSFGFDQTLSGPQQQALDYYVSGRANNEQQVDENASPVHLVEGLDYLPMQLDSAGAQNLAYLIEQLNPSAAQAATNYQQQQPLEDESSNGNGNDIINNDDDDNGGDEQVKISAPINDPFEFAEQANNKSQEIPIGAALSTHLDEVLKELYRRQEAEKASEQQDNGQLFSAPTTGEPMDQQFDEGDQEQQQASASASTTSASRYGGGEYIDHPLALIGHQYVQGGAGEGRQLLGPDGAFENVQVVKTDHAVPSYCDPPNPCPIGYSAEDGCLEKFVNSASFSREYQAKQQCSCDNEHSLFNCAAPISALKSPDYSATSAPLSTNNIEQTDSNTDNADDGRRQESGSLEALARTIQNRFGNLNSVRNVIANYKGAIAPEEHNLPERYSSVSKKAYKIDTDFKY